MDDLFKKFNDNPQRYCSEVKIIPFITSSQPIKHLTKEMLDNNRDQLSSDVCVAGKPGDPIINITLTYSDKRDNVSLWYLLETIEDIPSDNFDQSLDNSSDLTVHEVFNRKIAEYKTLFPVDQ